MSAEPIFLDTNVWIYSFSESSDTRGQIAKSLIERHYHQIIISPQVLSEIYNVLTGKLRIDKKEAELYIDECVHNFSLVTYDAIVIKRAISVHIKYPVSFWDSIIVATALDNRATILYSEDMAHNMKIDDVLTIINPFT